MDWWNLMADIVMPGVSTLTNISFVSAEKSSVKSCKFL